MFSNPIGLAEKIIVAGATSSRILQLCLLIETGETG